MPAETELERLHDAHASTLFAFLLNLTRDPEDTRELLRPLHEELSGSTAVFAACYGLGGVKRRKRRAPIRPPTLAGVYQSLGFDF